MSSSGCWTCSFGPGGFRGERIGADASTMEANATMRTIVHRDTDEGYRRMLLQMAEESGMRTPDAEDLSRLDRKRKGKKVTNADWKPRTDPEARIAPLKNRRTRLAYKPDHAVDMDSGAAVAAEVHPAGEGDTTTLGKTVEATGVNLSRGAMARRPSARRSWWRTRATTCVGCPGNSTADKGKPASPRLSTTA